MKKTYLMFALLLSLMGVNGAGHWQLLSLTILPVIRPQAVGRLWATTGMFIQVMTEALVALEAIILIRKMITTVQITIMCLDTAQTTTRMFGWY